MSDPEKLSGFYDALMRSLCHFEGARNRWEKLRRRGATDAELMEAIRYEYYIQGGSSGPNMIPETHKGGRNPAVWIGQVIPKGKPTLAGRALIEKVRAVLAIPRPPEGVQGLLFEEGMGRKL